MILDTEWFEWYEVLIYLSIYHSLMISIIAHSAGVVEYINSVSAEGYDPTQLVSCSDTKQSDGEVPAMLELWEMRSTPLLPSLQGPLWPGLVAPDKDPI